MQPSFRSIGAPKLLAAIAAGVEVKSADGKERYRISDAAAQYLAFVEKNHFHKTLAGSQPREIELRGLHGTGTQETSLLQTRSSVRKMRLARVEKDFPMLTPSSKVGPRTIQHLLVTRISKRRFE